MKQLSSTMLISGVLLLGNACGDDSGSKDPNDDAGRCDAGLCPNDQDSGSRDATAPSDARPPSDDGSLDAHAPSDASDDSAVQGDADAESPDTGVTQPDAGDDGGNASDAGQDAATTPDAAQDAATPSDAGTDAGNSTGNGVWTAPDGFGCGAPSPSGNTLLSFGHSTVVVHTKTTPTRVLSEQQSGEWVLWDRTNGKQITRGEAGNWSMDGVPGFNDLAGNTFAVAYSSSVEIRNATDGSLLSTIPIQPSSARYSVGLASDGSYLWDTLSSNLRIWSLNGTMKLSTPLSNTVSSRIFAAPDAVHAAETSGTSPVVRHIPIDGTAPTSDAFTGTFANWFTDGGYYLTLAANAIRVYPQVGAQTQIVFTSAQQQWVGGYGSYFWYQGTNGTAVQKVGDAQPVTLSSPFSGYFYSGDSMLNGDQMSVLDLRTASVVSHPLTLAISSILYPSDPAYSSWSSVGSQWANVGPGTTVAIGDTFDAPATYLGCQFSTVVAASKQGKVALALSDQSIRLFDVSGAQPTAVANIHPGSSTRSLAFSADGSILVVLSAPSSGSVSTLQAYSLSSGTSLWSHTGIYKSFAMADLSSTLGVLVSCTDSTTAHCSAQVLQASNGTTVGTAVALTPVVVPPQSVATLPAVALSTDGTSLAVGTSSGVLIYQNGNPVGAAGQPPLGWLSPTELLVGKNSEGLGNAPKPIVVDATGTTVRTFTNVTNYYGFRAIDTTHYFAVGSVYSSQDGTVTWMNPTNTPAGVYAGSHVIAATNGQVVSQAGPP